jgi:uncharacterized protein (DUF58 family)
MVLISTFSLWLYQRVTRRYEITPTARGVWNFGPAFLRAGDPFGFLDHEIPAPNPNGAASVIVLPIVAPLTAFGLPPRHPFGDINARQRFIDDPTQIVGARDYIPGDPLRQIHWKATARSATLQSKIYPPTTTHVLTIFMDSNTTQDPTFGIDPTLLELGIAAAASVAAWATEHKFSVGVFTNGLPAASDDEIANLEEAQAFMRVPPSHHPDQLGRILEALARIQPFFGGAMDTLLAREQKRLALGTTVIYVSAAAALSGQTLQRLSRWQRHGHTVTLLLTGKQDVATGELRV